jgi:hypothetical protein
MLSVLFDEKEIICAAFRLRLATYTQLPHYVRGEN